MRSARVLGSAIFVALVLVAASEACRAATQVTLDIRTLAACTDMKDVNIIVAPQSFDAETRATTGFSTTSTSTCTAGNIGTLVLTPSDDGERAAVLIIAGFSERAETCIAPLYRGCIVQRRRFTFIPHTGVTLPIVLDPACVDVPCGATETCTGKRCVDSEVTCSESGTCTEPGKNPDGSPKPPIDGSAGEDGPIANVDGSGPDAVVAADSESDAPSDAPPLNDAPNDTGSSSGTPGIGFGECGSGYQCPLGGLACPAGNVCCIGPPTGPVCQGPNAPCANGSGIRYCCGGTDHCGVGHACCASNANYATGLKIACGTPNDCLNGGNTFLCRTDSSSGTSAECPPGQKCGPSTFGGGFLKCVP